MSASVSELQNAFDRSLREKSELQMTPEEATKFRSAFEQEEFRQLLSEYMDEIRDPQYRAEQEAYIRQLEADNKVPTNKELIHPTPGFVVKAHRSGQEQDKVFLNIVSHERLDQPTKSKASNGENWALPYSLGPSRIEKDKRGQEVLTRDICFHPTAVVTAQREQRFRDLIVQTAIEAWEDASLKTEGKEFKLERTYHVLRGVAYKCGAPATMVLARPVEDQKGASGESDGREGSQSDEGNAAKKNGAATTQESGDAKATTAAKKKSGPRAPKEPKYTITYRSQFELQNYTMASSQDRSGGPRPRPKELVIRVEVPLMKNAREMELDVSELQVQFKAGHVYDLALALPYPVLESEGSAKFDKSSRSLQITLPVRPESVD